ncbi:hypothetical protein EYF80_055042 [Liparis tanakae]|uniref:Uncharacterized protein n=1 Tax=Liparis tanakae TaxID=230148 RepID=A0A4Z2F197_9TELE|nr:hypothetical protein EYF80_055042 [Liparis tanakae]
MAAVDSKHTSQVQPLGLEESLSQMFPLNTEPGIPDLDGSTPSGLEMKGLKEAFKCSHNAFMGKDAPATSGLPSLLRDSEAT